MDSNIIIYSGQPPNSRLRAWILKFAPAVSAISFVEVLGFHRLTDEDRCNFELFFEAATDLPLTDNVLRSAVILRKSKKMTLGDSLIVATALANQMVLATHNLADFAGIPGLKLHGPMIDTESL